MQHVLLLMEVLHLRAELQTQSIETCMVHTYSIQCEARQRNVSHKLVSTCNSAAPHFSVVSYKLGLSDSGLIPTLVYFDCLSTYTINTNILQRNTSCYGTPKYCIKLIRVNFVHLCTYLNRLDWQCS